MPAARRLTSDRQLSPLVGAAVAVLAVAAATALIFPLKQGAPVVSLGVVYLAAVLLVSTRWGLVLGVTTSVLSATAFNFFHIPPTGRFTIADEQNWVALAAFVGVAVFASTIAEAARSRASEAEARRQEADLAAELARGLIAGGDVSTLLSATAERLGDALGVTAAIELGAVDAPEGQEALPLRAGERQVATLLLPADRDEALSERLREHVLPSLEALVVAVVERDALQAEAVEAAALRRSDELKTAILRAVSHDLRTPLTSIIASAEALRSPALTGDDREELAVGVVSEAERLSHLIANLLDLSRLEGGSAQPRRDWCSIEEVLVAAGESVDGELRYAIDPKLPFVRADAVQLERAFANLIANGVDHSGGRPVSIRARAVRGRVLVRIVDQGPGIAPAELNRVFEAFWRGAEHVSGSGLGLAIVRGFVEANGGRVWVESLPGQGSSFVVELPVGEDGAQ